MKIEVKHIVNFIGKEESENEGTASVSASERQKSLEILRDIVGPGAVKKAFKEKTIFRLVEMTTRLHNCEKI